MPSVELGPVSELATYVSGLVTAGAVVSIVMESWSDAATISPAINCRALYVHVPSANTLGVQVSDTFCGTKLQTTFANPLRVNVMVVSIAGTKSPMTTVGVESERGVLFTVTGIPAEISRTVMSPLEVADAFGR